MTSPESVGAIPVETSFLPELNLDPEVNVDARHLGFNLSGGWLDNLDGDGRGSKISFEYMTQKREETIVLLLQKVVTARQARLLSCAFLCITLLTTHLYLHMFSRQKVCGFVDPTPKTFLQNCVKMHQLGVSDVPV